tara:strand:+ start:188 stop:463 length:276 start_codon:yes stop_codon:yes gene_type:complete
MKKQTLIITGFLSFSIGVATMWAIDFDKDINNYLFSIDCENTIRENINTCEDMIEWMNEDIWNERVDSTHYEGYIYNLELMIEENKCILKK